MKFSENILKIEPYRPGKPIEETKRELGLSHVIKLASNECPLGPSAAVQKALTEAISELHRYPDPSCHDLSREYARYLGVPENFIVFGNGSNELIDLIFRAFCQPGDIMLTSQYAFIAYKISAQVAGLQVLEVGARSDKSFNLSAMIDEIRRQPRIKVVCLANPNNPTGSYINARELETFLNEVGGREDLIVVIDEAYAEFVRAEDYPQGIDKVRQYENVVVLRTMSKFFGLAGLRLGALIGQPSIVSVIHRIRNPFNVNMMAQVAALASLKDVLRLESIKDMVWAELEKSYRELERLKLKYWPSQANFVLVDFAKEAEPIFQNLLKKGVILRPLKNYGLPTCLRISMGTEKEMAKAFEALRDVLRGG